MSRDVVGRGVGGSGGVDRSGVSWSGGVDRRGVAEASGSSLERSGCRGGEVADESGRVNGSGVDECGRVDRGGVVGADGFGHGGVGDALAAGRVHVHALFLRKPFDASAVVPPYASSGGLYVCLELDLVKIEYVVVHFYGLNIEF